MKDAQQQVDITTVTSNLNDERLHSHEGHMALDVPEVTWYKDPGLRKLYAMMPIFMLGATLTGYDGSLLNGLQTMDPWQTCKSPIGIYRRYLNPPLNVVVDFDHPSGARLGLFSAIQNVGGATSVVFGMNGLA